MDAELACDRLRGAGIISGDHDGSQATPVQSLKASGVSAKMIRYYESIGLVPKPGRTGGGYRAYSDADIHRLRFVRRARDLGFAVDQVGELLRLWSEQNRSHADVRSLALEHIRDLEHRATQLRAMIITLKQLVSACEDAHRPECPIIRELESGRTRLKAVGKATWRGVRS